jgi:predicted O-methyltransferase YrrM
MYNHFTLIIKYIAFYLKAKKLHGVHSPFVYRFSKEVLYKKIDHSMFKDIEACRQDLLQSAKEITVEDLGAGSRIHKTNTRLVKDIARNALKPRKWAVLIHKIVAYFHCRNCIELGTCLGITTAYIAKAHNNINVFTVEGSQSIYDMAKEIGYKLNISNTKYIHGNFNNQLPVLLESVPALDCIYIDGNHKYEPTINYFNQALTKTHEGTIMIFDDIHWSSEMEQAWNEIKNHSRVTVSIDLFFIGIIFFRKEQMEKEHFRLRY